MSVRLVSPVVTLRWNIIIHIVPRGRFDANSYGVTIFWRVPFRCDRRTFDSRMKDRKISVRMWERSLSNVIMIHLVCGLIFFFFLMLLVVRTFVTWAIIKVFSWNFVMMPLFVEDGRFQKFLLDKSRHFVRWHHLVLLTMWVG